MKHPCIGCKYFKTCGNTNRVEPCKGRELGNSVMYERWRVNEAIILDDNLKNYKWEV